MDRRLFRSIPLLETVAIAAALAYATALYLANLLAWPGNVSVREWWGSELAIRYCAGFVRRGILGQLSWQISGWFGHQSSYALALSLVTAATVLLLGLWLAWHLVRRSGWRLGLLILAAPAGWPVLMVHGGATFRKDPLQILLGVLLLWLWRERVRDRSPAQAPDTWLVLAGVEIVAVFNHEPFALLILPTLAIAVHWQSRDWRRALLAISPGLLAFLLAIWRKGTASQVACLRADLQRLGLLAPSEMPGSSITELARSRPSYPTWDLDLSQLGWSVFHLLAMSMVVVLAYALLLRLSQPSNGLQPGFGKACSLWAIQLGVAMPLFVTTVDYGRMMAMTFCSGLAYLLLFRTPNPAAMATVAPRSDRLWPAAWLALLELWLLPSHCCTYSIKQIIAFVPYAAASQWKALLLDWLAVVPASLPR
jgi:hypothetical protein